MFTIGRLARRARVNADSIRFYERQGLLAPAAKTDSGYRLYTEEAVRRIAFIKHAQLCGFSLAEIGGLLHMHERGSAGRGEAYRLAAEKQSEIQKTMAALQAMSHALTSLLASRASDDGTNPDAGANLLLNALESGMTQRGSERTSAFLREQRAAA